MDGSKSELNNSGAEIAEQLVQSDADMPIELSKAFGSIALSSFTEGSQLANRPKYIKDIKIPKGTRIKLEKTDQELRDYRQNRDSYKDDYEANEEFREAKRAIEVGKNYPEYYADWQVECLEAIKNQSNVLLSSPTGSGKTTVFLDWAKEKKKEAEAKNPQSTHTVYITAPIKALSNQRYRDLKKAGYKVGLETGDVKIVPDDADYICCTQEIYTNKYANNENATLIVDEFHYMAEDPNRTRAYIDGIHNSNAKNMLLCSATLGNIDDLGGYVEKVTNRSFRNYENHERLTEFEVGGYIKSDEIENALVIAFSKSNCEAVASRLRYRYKSYEYDEEEYPPDDIETIQKIRQREQQIVEICNKHDIEYNGYFKDGIGLYYGSMLPKEKACVEELFEKRLIDTVVGTDALALGVNFPVDKVVFAQMEKYKGHGESEMISKNLFDQLAGRAGRKGYFDKGAVYYCDDFSNDRGYYLQSWGSSRFDELLSSKNENIIVTLSPNYELILNGNKSIEEEIEYINKYSTFPLTEEKKQKMIAEISDLTSLSNDIFKEIVENAYFKSKESGTDDGLAKILPSIQYHSGYYYAQDTHYEWRKREVIYGYWVKYDCDDDDYSKFIETERISLRGNEDYLKAEKQVLSECGMNSLEEYNDFLIREFADCFDPRLENSTNKYYFKKVFKKDIEGFEEKIQLSYELLKKYDDKKEMRDLIQIREYLLNLPKKYRVQFADTILKTDMLINHIDETILSEGRGRIPLSEVSEFLWKQFSAGTTRDSINKKIRSNIQPTKGDIEFLLRSGLDYPGVVDRNKVYNLDFDDVDARVENQINSIKFKDIINSGIDLDYFLNKIADKRQLYRGANQTNDEVQYCLDYLININLLKQVSDATEFIKTIPFELIIKNYDKLIANGVELNEKKYYEEELEKNRNIDNNDNDEDDDDDDYYYYDDYDDDYDDDGDDNSIDNDGSDNNEQ